MVWVFTVIAYVYECTQLMQQPLELRFSRSATASSEMGAPDGETCVLCLRMAIRLWKPEDLLCHRCVRMRDMLVREFRSQFEDQWLETLTRNGKNQLLLDFSEFKRRPFSFADWRDSRKSTGETEAPARPPPTSPTDEPKRRRMQPGGGGHASGSGRV